MIGDATPAQPVVADGVGRRYAVVGIHLETATQEVDEQGVVGGLARAGADESRDEVARQRRTAEPTALRVAAGDDVDAALVHRLDAVARHAAGRQEVALALARLEQLLARRAEHLDYARHLVALVFAGKQRVTRQQLHHDAACSKQRL